MSALEVRLGAVRVGILERFKEWDYRFSFDDSWLRMAEPPVLGQLFEDRKPHDIESTGNLLCWFDHLLPQGGLRAAPSPSRPAAMRTTSSIYCKSSARIFRAP